MWLTPHRNYGSAAQEYSVVGIFEEKCVYNHVFLANIYNNIGLSYQYLKKYKDAKKFLKKALDIKKEIFDNNSIEIAISYDNLGGNYFYEGNLGKSLEYRLKSDEIIQNIDAKETKNTSILYSNIGITYYLNGDCVNAIKYQLRSLEISKKILGNDNANTILQCGKLGEYYRVSGDAQKIKYFLKYINGIENIVKKISLQDKDLFYSACTCVSNYYYDLGNIKEAKIYYEKLLKHNII